MLSRSFALLCFSACSWSGDQPAMDWPAEWTESVPPPGLPGPIDSSLSLELTQPASIGGSLELTVSGAVPGQVVAIVASYAGLGPSTMCPRALDNNCVSLVDPEIVALGVADPTGSFVIQRPVPHSIVAASVRYYQAGAAVGPLVTANLSPVLPVSAVATACPVDDFAEQAGSPDGWGATRDGTFIPLPTTPHTYQLRMCPYEVPFDDTGMDTGPVWMPPPEDYDHYWFVVPPGKVVQWRWTPQDMSSAANDVFRVYHGPDGGFHFQTSTVGSGWGQLFAFNETGADLDVRLTAQVEFPALAGGVPYGFTVQQVDPCEPDLFEPNDSAAQATPPGPIVGSGNGRLMLTGYTCAGDEDWFDVPAGTRTISMTPTSQQVQIDVYDAGSLALLQTFTTVYRDSHPFDGNLPGWTPSITSTGAVKIRITHASDLGSTPGGSYHGEVRY